MTILIKGAQIFSGGERLTDRSDIFISGDKISAIGSFSAKIADKVIDAQGCYVSPGFIDVNTDSDHYLSVFSDPLQEDFLRQGVTTIIGGQCGSSLAPLIYGRLDSLRKWTDTTKINVNWHEVAELLAFLEKHPLGVNFATLVGHSTIRRDIVGEEARNLTAKEVDVFTHVLAKAMRQGGAGLSTGLSYVHSAATSPLELEELAKIVKKQEGVYTTHLRDRAGGVAEPIDEAITLHRNTGVKTIISHFIPVLGEEDLYRSGLEKLRNLDPASEMYFDLSPFPIRILPIYYFLPDWAKQGGLSEMYENLTDDWLRSKVQKEITDIDPEKIIISRADKNDVLVGRSIRDCMELYGVDDYKEALIKVMIATELRAAVFYESINQDLLMEALTHPRCLIASNAASLSKTSEIMLKPERARRTFPKFLSLVEEKRIMPIEVAIERITKKPASLFQIEKRGEIKEGFFADVTGFRNGEILFTIVNGHLAFENHSFDLTPHGKILRHRSHYQ
ncbi:MAG: hypothetical protein AAB691_02775 [Patescibacteria group bacterium]